MTSVRITRKCSGCGEFFYPDADERTCGTCVRSPEPNQKDPETQDDSPTLQSFSVGTEFEPIDKDTQEDDIDLTAWIAPYSSYRSEPMRVGREHTRKSRGQSIEEQKYKGDIDRYTGYYGKNWPEAREKALKRDGYECTHPRCTITNNEHRERDDLFADGLHVHNIVECHHFDTYEEANAKSNLRSYCSLHHPIPL